MMSGSFNLHMLSGNNRLEVKMANDGVPSEDVHFHLIICYIEKIIPNL